MNKRALRLLVILAIPISLLMGCASPADEVVVPSLNPAAPSAILPQPTVPSNAAQANGVTPPENQVIKPQEGEPPIDRTWISPGKVNVGNFYPGARAEWYIQIHNGSDGKRSEQKEITTEVGETRGSVPIKGIPVSNEGSAFTVTGNLTFKPLVYSEEGMTLQIGGFKPGMRLIIFVGYTTATQHYKEWVGTVAINAGETTTAIHLKEKPLYPAPESFTVTSAEKFALSSVSYSTIDHTLLIDGFTPDATMIITIEYVSQAQFSVYYREPDHLLEGYESAPSQAKDWVIIADKSPVIMPQTTEEIMVALDMPADYKRELPPRWEFWIGVSEAGDTGMVVTELCSRWLITSKET